MKEKSEPENLKSYIILAVISILFFVLSIIYFYKSYECFYLNNKFYFEFFDILIHRTNGIIFGFLFAFIGTTFLSFMLPEKLREKVHIPLSYIVGLIIMVTFFIYVYTFIITPFRSNDLSTDLGILILKDEFVRFVWIILDLVIVAFFINFIWNKTKNLKKMYKIENWNFKKNKKDKAIKLCNVRDFMNSQGYISVHKNVRSNSDGFLYITFIKENNEAENIYFSSKISSSYHKNQEIKKGFFDNLLIEISDNNIKLIGN